MTWYFKQKRRKFAFLFIFPLIIILSILYIFSQFSPVFSSLCDDKMYYTIFKISNQVVEEKLSKINNENLVICQYDADGKVSTINANVSTMNKLSAEISTTLSERLAKLGDMYIRVPIGSLLSSNFFAATGPAISLKIYPLTTIKASYRTEFESTGINQTVHRIFININCSITVLSKLVTHIQEVHLEIPVAETIIVGNVPNTYLKIQ